MHQVLFFETNFRDNGSFEENIETELDIVQPRTIYNTSIQVHHVKVSRQ